MRTKAQHAAIQVIDAVGGFVKLSNRTRYSDKDAGVNFWESTVHASTARRIVAAAPKEFELSIGGWFIRRIVDTTPAAPVDPTVDQRDPKIIDKELAALTDTWYAIQDRVDSLVKRIRYATNQTQDFYGRQRVWVLRNARTQMITVAHTLELGRAAAERGDTYGSKPTADLMSEYDATVAEGAKVQEMMAPLNAAHAARRWSRFLIVTSSNGHIHSSTHCGTCRITTRFGWLPELSGESEADAVAAHGALLCTVCFPSAPLEFTNGRAKK